MEKLNFAENSVKRDKIYSNIKVDYYDCNSYINDFIPINKIELLYNLKDNDNNKK